MPSRSVHGLALVFLRSAAQLSLVRRPLLAQDLVANANEKAAQSAPAGDLNAQTMVDDRY